MGRGLQPRPVSVMHAHLAAHGKRSTAESGPRARMERSRKQASKRAVLRVHGSVVEADAAAQRVLQRPAGGALRGRLQALLLRAVTHEAARRAAAHAVGEQVLGRVRGALARAARRRCSAQAPR